MLKIKKKVHIIKKRTLNMSLIYLYFIKLLMAIIINLYVYLFIICIIILYNYILYKMYNYILFIELLKKRAQNI